MPRSSIYGSRAGRVSAVATRDGRVFEAEVVVVTAGPWTSRVFPALPIRVQPTAARLHYLKPRDPEPFSLPRLTPFSVMDTQFYGFPVHWRGCVKVADDMIGEPFDPDRDREHEDPAALAKLRTFLTRHLPDLSEAPVIYSKTCTYSMTPRLRLHHRPGTEPRQCADRGRVFRTRVQVRHTDRPDPGRPGNSRHNPLGPDPFSAGSHGVSGGPALVRRWA